MKFSALNKEVSNNSSFSSPSSKRGRPTQEAQESICLKLYHDAMKHQQEGKWGEAKALYCEILESELMEEACGSSAMSPSCLPSSSTITRLKFLIYKNMASIAKEQGDLSAAMDACIEATSVDATDVTVWSQLASLASSLGNLLLARKALEHALCCQANHWPAIENLCTVLFALQDYTACLHVISKGLQLDPHFPRGLVYLKQMIMEQPDILNHHQLHQLQIHMMTEQPEARDIFLEDAEVLHRRREALNEVEALWDPILPPRKLSTPTMYCLATCLYALYKHCRDLSSRQSHFLVPIDFSTFIDTNSPNSTLSPPGKGSPSCEALEELPQTKMSGEIIGREGISMEEAKVGSVRREAKRKLLEGLEAFVPKRRSSRVITRRKEKEHKNYFDMLYKYLPHWLMLKELPELSELSPLKELQQTDEERFLSKQRQAVAALINSTPYLVEAEEVCKFIREMEGNSGVIQVLFNFTLFLSLHYDKKWCEQPAPLVRMFVDVYKCLHQHLSFPSALCSPVEAQEEKFQQVAMVALCYVEMYIDTCKQKIISQDSTWSTCPSFRDCLAFAQHCSGLVGVAPLGKVTFTLRVQWCLGKLYQLTCQQDAATRAYTMCKDLLQVFCVEEEGPRTLLVYLPNLLNAPIISLDHVTERLRELERSISLKQVEQLFLQKKYAVVAARLQSVLDHASSIPLEFLLGTKTRGPEVTSLSLLLDSLFFLDLHHSCLETAVRGALQLLQHQFYGNYLWIAAIMNTFTMMGNCLENDVALETVRKEAGVRLVKQLMVCVLKVMDSVYDMAENSDLFLTMPICLPWKIFYIVISSDWRASVSVEEADLMEVEADSQACSAGCIATTSTTIIGEEPVTEIGATLREKEASSSLEEMEIDGKEEDEKELVLCTPLPSPASSTPCSPPCSPPVPAASTPCSSPVPAASTPHSPPVPAASTPCSSPVPAASTPHSPPVPTTSTPHSPPVPAASTPHSSPVSSTPHSPPVPAASTPHSPPVPAASAPHSPPVPAASTPHSPPVPAASTPHSPPVPAASTPCSPPVPAASTPHSPPVPAASTPCSPPVPAASTPHSPPVPAASTPHSPPVPAVSTPHSPPVPAASTPHSPPVPTTSSPCSSPAASTPHSSPVSSTPHSPPVPAASTPCSPPVPAASTPHSPPVPTTSTPHSSPVPTTSSSCSSPAASSPCFTPPVPAASPVLAASSVCSPSALPGPVLASGPLPGSCKTTSPFSPSSYSSVATYFSSSPCGPCPPSREALSPFLGFLLVAHNHLGQMGWCCRQGGIFLTQSVRALRKELTILTRWPAKQRDLLLQELEQCYYCLYGHPNKKAKVRGLLDHSSEQIPLTWESALMLIEHYHPVPLPSIDDTKSPQITAEVISLYKRIVDVLPDYGKVLSKESLEQFIEGQSAALTTPQPPHQDSSIISDVYYILADDALNCMENHKSIRYYQETICYLPGRFDSWAGLALGRSRIIMDKLNQRDSKGGMEKYIRKNYVATITCFKKAVSLNTKHCSIIEKFGFFCYTVQSFVSQLLCQPLCPASGVQPWSATMHREMLTQAEQCFTEALRLEGTRYAEPWIYYWMLGKVGRKLQAPVKHIMNNFVKSSKTLFQDGASHPGLVELSSKNNSVEAIEVHYQLHSSALKFLIPFYHKASPSQDQHREETRLAVEAAIAEALMSLTDMPLSTKSYPPLWAWVQEIIGSASRGEMASGKSCMGDGRVAVLDKTDAMEVDEPIVSGDGSHDQLCGVVGGMDTSQEEIGISLSSWDYVSLLQLCLYGVAMCAVRFPAFFKPLYRMAATLLTLGLPQHARALLLGPLPPQLLQCQDKLQPLFVLRTNIFTNMWQVPCEEVNRPGSFSSHARRSVELLVKVLVELREHKTLLHLAQLLKSRPDSNKQYLRDNERRAVHVKIVRNCVKVLVEVSKERDMSSSDALGMKSVVVSVRNMASKLENNLIKDLDGVLEHLQVHIVQAHDEPPVTSGTTPTLLPVDQLTTPTIQS